MVTWTGIVLLKHWQDKIINEKFAEIQQFQNIEGFLFGQGMAMINGLCSDVFSIPFGKKYNLEQMSCTSKGTI